MSDFNPLSWVDKFPTGSDFLQSFKDGMQNGQQIADTFNQDRLNKEMAAGAQSGNFSQVEQDALRTGHTDVYNNVQALKQKQVEQASMKLGAIGSAAYDLLHITDPVQRQQVFETTYKPILAQRGIPADMLARVDLSDNGLKGYLGQAMDLKTKLETSKGVVVGDSVVNPYSGDQLYKGNKLTYQNVTAANGMVMPFAVDQNNSAVPLGAGLPGQAPQGAPPRQVPQVGVSGGFGGGTFNTSGQQVTPTQDNSAPAPAAPAAPTLTPQQVISRSMGFEGRQGHSFNPKDMNGSPTNWGINWASNQKTLEAMGFTPATFPNMTQDQAAQVYQQNYWNQSGAAKLPANLQGPYFDAFIRSPARAQQWLAAATGPDGQVDPVKFEQIAGPGFQRIAANAAAQGKGDYQKAYANRDAANLQAVSGGGGSVSPAPIQSSAQPSLISPSLTPQQFLAANSQKDGPDFHGAPIPKDASYWTDAKGNPHFVNKGTPTPADPPIEVKQGLFSKAYQDVISGKPQGFGMGGGDKGYRPLYLQYYAQIQNALGLSGADGASQAERYKALGKAYSTEQMQISQIGGALGGLQRNLGQFLENSKQLPDWGTYTLNSLVNKVRGEFGNPQLAQLMVSTMTSAAENARAAVSSASGAGTLSDSARTDYNTLVDANMPMQARIAAAKQIMIDVENVRQGRVAQHNDTQRQMYTTPDGRDVRGLILSPTGQVTRNAAPAAPSGGLPVGAKLIGYSQGRPVVQLPDGRKLVGPSSEKMPIGVSTPWGTRR